MSQRIKVLIVDDSAVVRKMISDALESDPQIESSGPRPIRMRGAGQDQGIESDVITLDIEMPRMDGLTFLKILQQHRPIPVIIVSSISQAGSAAAMTALQNGAVEVLAKTQYGVFDRRAGGAVAPLCQICCCGRLQRRLSATDVAGARPENRNARPSCRPAAASFIHVRSSPLALALAGGSADASAHSVAGGIAGHRHHPAHSPHFSRVFAERINGQSALEVREAAEGDLLKPERRSWPG